MATLSSFMSNEHHRVLNRLQALFAISADQPMRLKAKFFDFYRLADPQLRAERGAVYGYLREKGIGDKTMVSHLSENGRRMELELWQYYDDSRNTPEWSPDLTSLYEHLKRHYRTVRVALDSFGLGDMKQDDFSRIDECYRRKRAEALVDIEQRVVHP